MRIHLITSPIIELNGEKRSVWSRKFGSFEEFIRLVQAHPEEEFYLLSVAPRIWLDNGFRASILNIHFLTTSGEVEKNLPEYNTRPGQ